jgi:restriction endonuclease S subunit
MNAINTNFTIKKLGDICVFLPKNNNPSNFGNEIGLYPFYTANIKNKYCNNANTYNEELIIIGNHLNINNNVSINISRQFSCSEHNFIIKINNANTKYIYYWLIKNIQNIKNLFCGSILLKLNKKALLNIEIPIPHIEIQRKIVIEYDNLINTIINN